MMELPCVELSLVRTSTCTFIDTDKPLLLVEHMASEICVEVMPPLFTSLNVTSNSHDTSILFFGVAKAGLLRYWS
jgi:hypothetical protein